MGILGKTIGKLFNPGQETVNPGRVGEYTSGAQSDYERFLEEDRLAGRTQQRGLQGLENIQTNYDVNLGHGRDIQDTGYGGLRDALASARAMNAGTDSVAGRQADLARGRARADAASAVASAPGRYNPALAIGAADAAGREMGEIGAQEGIGRLREKLSSIQALGDIGGAFSDLGLRRGDQDMQAQLYGNQASAGLFNAATADRNAQMDRYMNALGIQAGMPRKEGFAEKFLRTSSMFVPFMDYKPQGSSGSGGSAPPINIPGAGGA